MKNLSFTDVTLRDGLQIESRLIPVAEKLQLFTALAACPYDRYEVTSFVHPKWIPQFADSENFLKALFQSPLSQTKELMAFVPNEKGLERLLEFPIPWATTFIAASNTFNQKNVNQSIDDTVLALDRVVQMAHQAKRKVRIYVSTVFGCPYEGAIPMESLFAVLDKVIALQPDEIALSDTIGVAEPTQVCAVLERFLKKYPADKTALHFHDTYGLAVAGASQAYDLGIRSFDGSTGGIGGCPYAKGATGNVAIESLLYLFFRRGVLPSFPKAQIQAVWKVLAETLKLTTHSQLFEIMEKGGALYGIG